MTEPGPDYSVVVPAFDEEALLPATLASIRAAMAAVPLAGEIVVCDNNSTDGTAAAARAGGARVVFEPHNQIARARNTGARAALGKWLVFVDADTEVNPGALRGALDHLASGRVVGGGCLVRMETGGRMGGGFLVRHWNWLSRTFRLAAGSFVFARRDAFEEVGGFPESHYAGEEIFLTFALKRWGRKRGLAFRVLDRDPVTTSPRKLDWYSSWTLAGTLFLMTLCPPLARSRSFCRIWYRRPAAVRAS
jgi:glycosyltransferase involved in cell wall biosynthesis